MVTARTTSKYVTVSPRLSDNIYCAVCCQFSSRKQNCVSVGRKKSYKVGHVGVTTRACLTWMPGGWPTAWQCSALQFMRTSLAAQVGCVNILAARIVENWCQTGLLDPCGRNPMQHAAWFMTVSRSTPPTVVIVFVFGFGIHYRKLETAGVERGRHRDVFSPTRLRAS